MPTWVVVGASRGIGYQYLQTLSRDASTIVIGIVRTTAPVEEKVVADELTNVHILQGDLTDSASLYAAAKEVSSITNGIVDYLVVNGVYPSLPTLGFTAGDYIGGDQEALLLHEMDISMRTNVIGALYSINAFMPLLLKSETKKVVCISSAVAATDIYATIGTSMKGQLPYSMSKAALNILTAKFAAQYRDEGVKFVALAPGYVLTVAPSMDELPTQLVPVFDGFTADFKKLNPDLQGPITTEESVDLQLKVIDSLTLDQSGQFLSQFGNKQWL